MRPLYIFDIDGTLANNKHRLHLLEAKNYDEYYADYNVLADTPILPTIHTAMALYSSGMRPEIWFFTGRRDSCKGATVQWLRRHVDKYVSPVRVVMRLTGDYRDDATVKQEMLDYMLVDDRERLVAVFDDRQRVVDMWRSNGIQCFQVAAGDF